MYLLKCPRCGYKRSAENSEGYSVCPYCGFAGITPQKAKNVPSEGERTDLNSMFNKGDDEDEGNKKT